MSSAKRVLMRSLDASGTRLRELSALLTEDEFFHDTPQGPSFAWTLMHIFALEDWTLNRVMRRLEPKLSYEVREAFKGGRAITSADRALFQSKLDIETMFSAEREETLLALSAFDDGRWDEPTPIDCRFPTLGTVWENLADDCWWHLGALNSSVPRFNGTLIAVTKPRYHSTDLDDGKHRLEA